VQPGDNGGLVAIDGYYFTRERIVTSEGDFRYVARLNDPRGNIGGTFECQCVGAGGCEVTTTGSLLMCTKTSCNGHCGLVVVIQAPTTSDPY
jgi:hypothetical protein